MLYLGIDQHRNQLTVDLGNEEGDLIEHRQVRTGWETLRKYFDELRRRSEAEGGYVAIVEVCGFNDYLLKLLGEYGCREIVLIQPQKRERKKTDRCDARKLRELLWSNRGRLLEGKRPAGLRRVRIVSAQEAADRQLTALRKRLAETRTRSINKVHHILLKHNLQHDCPTQGIKSVRARKWLKELSLPEIDRLEVEVLLKQWELLDEQLKRVDEQIRQRQSQVPAAATIASIPGISAFGSLTISSRLGSVEHFPRGSSAANFVGLAPGCRNSGETRRPGSITKEGSSMIRFVLAQAVTHVLRRDSWLRQWYTRIKRRRGTSIARVAVMRHLMTVIWSMLKHDMPYVTGGPEAFRQSLTCREALALRTKKPTAA